jgi:tight adherence protein C
LVNFTRPFFRQYFLPVVRQKPFWDKYRKEYKRKIIAAGLRDELTPDEFIAFKLVLILFFPLVGVALKLLGFIDVSIWIVFATGGLGWFYPDSWVNGRMKQRQKQVLRSMPFVVDLLALSTEAGLDFMGAIGKVVEKASPSPLIEEMSQLLKEIKVGASRQEALREMGLRISLTEVNSFIAILISADQMGQSIGKILRQQSDQIRMDRVLRAEKAGVQAAQLLQLMTVYYLVPILSIVMGPLIVGWLTGGDSGGVM